MLHGARQLPEVWRSVSDSFPQTWGVVAPQLHGRTDLGAMNQASVHDLGQVLVQPPIFVVATEEGAIPALEFCARNVDTGDIAGLLLSDPQLAVTSGAVRSAKMAARLHGDRAAPRSADGKFTNARYVQRAGYLQALAGISLSDQIRAVSAAGLPVRILAAENNRRAIASARTAHAAFEQAEFFTIAQAQADWNAYAPAHFAANVMEFVALHIQGGGDSAS